MGYTFVTADLITGATLGELPLYGVEYDKPLDGIGLLRGKLDLGDYRVTDADPLGASKVSRTALYVDRNGVLDWGGVLWFRGKAKDQGDRIVLEIRAEEFGSYFQRRRFIVDTLVFRQVDQLEIARDLFRYAAGLPLVAGTDRNGVATPTFAKPNGNIGITLGTNVSGVLRDRTYNGSEQKPIWEALVELGSVIDGFDFAIDTAYDGANNRTQTLTLSYPRRGRTFVTSGWVFEKPGNMTDYAYPEDGYQIATTGYATGADVGSDVLRASYTNTALIDAGYPLLERASQYKDVSAQATLDSHVIADVSVVAKELVIPTLKVRADRDPVLGSYITGDDARVRITDARHPNTLDTYFRITLIRVRPPDANGQAEEVELETVPV